MDDIEIRDRALSAATITSPMEDGEPGPVLGRALVFEDYLRNGVPDTDPGEPNPHDAGLVSRLRNLFDARPGEGTLVAARRFQERVREAVEDSIADRIESACGGLLLRLENATQTQPAIRAWIQDCEGAFRTRSPFPEAPPANAVSDAEVDEARQRLLEQLAVFAERPGGAGLADWLREVALALAKSEPWPMPERFELTSKPGRDELYGRVLRRLITIASTTDLRVAKWLASVRDTMDQSNGIETVELPRLEPIDPFATAPVPEDAFAPGDPGGVWIARGPDSSAPPDDVEVLLAANGFRLRRASWTTTDTGDGGLWQWEYGQGTWGWAAALGLAADDAFPLRDVTTEDRQAAEQPPRHALEPIDDSPSVPASATPHDDPAKSSKPERYELRGLDVVNGRAEGPRSVLICLDCVAELGDEAGGRGNVVNVKDHDRYHDERDREGTRP